MSYNAGLRGSALTLFSVDANFGLRGINKQDEFEFKRFLSKANYFYLKAGFTQAWSFLDYFEWTYEFKGQYTESPLISNEQFSAGGVDTVRGYLEATAVGDNGLLASTEINFSPFRSMDTNTGRGHLQSLELSVFVDAARLAPFDRLPNVEGEFDSRSALLSAGIGMKLKAFKDMNAALYLAHPFNKLESESFKSEGLIHFNLVYNFK